MNATTIRDDRHSGASTAASANPPVDVAIVGGGPAGLTAAVVAARAGRSVVLYEKASAPGGRAVTREIDGYRFNVGPPR